MQKLSSHGIPFSQLFQVHPFDLAISLCLQFVREMSYL